MTLTVMVCVEHFTKWVELIPLPLKSSRDSARGFLEGVLSIYWALGKVLTDQVSDFLGEFQSLLSRHEITHRLASREQPYSDGQASRMVQTMSHIYTLRPTKSGREELVPKGNSASGTNTFMLASPVASAFVGSRQR